MFLIQKVGSAAACAAVACHAAHADVVNAAGGSYCVLAGVNTCVVAVLLRLRGSWVEAAEVEGPGLLLLSLKFTRTPSASFSSGKS